MFESVALIRNFCRDHGFKFRDDYSAREMYGKTCVGIEIGASTNPFAAGMAFAGFISYEGMALDDAALDIGASKVDSTESGHIIYFPAISVR